MAVIIFFYTLTRDRINHFIGALLCCVVVSTPFSSDRLLAEKITRLIIKNFNFVTLNATFHLIFVADCTKKSDFITIQPDYYAITINDSVKVSVYSYVGRFILKICYMNPYSFLLFVSIILFTKIWCIYFLHWFELLKVITFYFCKHAFFLWYELDEIIMKQQEYQTFGDL